MELGKTFLAIGIAIIFALFISYGVSVIYKSPPGGCSGVEECKLRSQQRQHYTFNLFIILMVIGIIAIIIGILIMSLEGIGSGILSGGVLVIIYGTFRAWGALNEYLRLGILAIALIVLIFLGYKKIEKIKQPTSPK